MKNIIISDLHLKENDKEFFKLKREELIKNTIKKIISNDNIERVIFNGDTFNESNVKNHGYVVSFFLNEVLKPLINNKKEVHILIGNHERFGKSHVFSFLEDEISNELIKIHKDITSLELDDFNAIFVPFMYPGDKGVRTIPSLQNVVEKELIDMVSDIKKNSLKPIICFNHNMMSDLPFDIGREMNLKIWEIPGIDFTFGGHIHKTEEFKVNNKVKGMYVGSFMKSFVYEEETEGFVSFNIDKEDNYNIKYYYNENKSYNYEKITIDDNSDFDEKTIKSNTVYDIDFLYSSQNPDHNFISDILIKIKEKKSFVKTQKIINKDANISLNKVVSLLTNENDILKSFLKDNSIKKDLHDEYYTKLQQCIDLIDISKQSNIDVDKKEEEKILKDVKKANTLNNIINKGLSL